MEIAGILEQDSFLQSRVVSAVVHVDVLVASFMIMFVPVPSWLYFRFLDVTSINKIISMGGSLRNTTSPTNSLITIQVQVTLYHEFGFLAEAC